MVYSKNVLQSSAPQKSAYTIDVVMEIGRDRKLEAEGIRKQRSLGDQVSSDPVNSAQMNTGRMNNGKRRQEFVAPLKFYRSRWK